MNTTLVHTFDWRLKEHAHVVELLMRERFKSGLWRAIRWSLWAILSLATMVAMASLLAGDLHSATTLGLLVIAVGILAFQSGKWTSLIRAWQARRVDPATRHPISLSLDDSGVRVLTQGAEVRLAWAGLHKAREVSDFFLFYYGPRIAYYLPKRVMESQAVVDTVRTLIRESLPSSVPFEEW